MKKRHIYISIGIAVLMTGAGLACKKQLEEKTEPTPVKMISLTDKQVKTLGIDTVKYTTEVSELSLTSKISFDEDKVSKVYPLASGNVMKVNVSLGDYVKKGQVMAILRSSEVNDYQSQYKVAVDNLALSKKNLDNAEQLFADKYYSQTQVLSARNDYHTAVAALNKIKQQLAIYGANADGTDAEYRVIAPTDGYIVEKNINENMQIRGDNSTNLFTVSYLNTVWLLADVYETDLAKVHVGDKVNVTTISYPDKVFQGSIKKISDVLDPVSKTLKIRIVLDNSDNFLKPEMFAIANVQLHSNKEEKHLEVPTKSLVFENSEYSVLVSQGNNTFKPIKVKVLRTVGDRSFVEGPLTPGQLVVTDVSLLTSASGN